ncbi:MAG: uroporphyrinogen-III synthase [Rhodocyclaceae bacterium]|nr:uroporphyrinogen-III synthase [Rhodocyclaceae bacterium]
MRFPVLAIFDTDRPEALQAAAAGIDAYDYAVFVSPNAAEKALGTICASRAWPENVVACAMGETSARAIAGFGVAHIITPQSGRFDSEALLERPEFAPARFAASAWRFSAATAAASCWARRWKRAARR